MTARAERFARQLAGRFGLPVARVDERYTTRGADAALRDGRRARRARARPRATRVAAQLILQAWFDDDAANATRGPA